MKIQGKTVRPYIPSLIQPDCKDADHLGIVMVHGVGFQTRGETLLAWSERLIRMLAAVYGPRKGAPADLVHRSGLDLAGDDLSFIELRIPGDDPDDPEGRRPQHWLVTEAFWAASFQQPTVQTMLAWLGARGAAALAARGFPVVKRLRNSVYLSGIVVGLLVFYSAIRVITSILPIAALRNALIGPLDRLLTGWSGDMHVLLFDPAQSADIRNRVRQAMQAVANAGFPRVAVVAHSGGAVASYMTLTDDAAWPEARPAQRAPPDVVSYVTLGQGLNIAWRLCGIGDGGSCKKASGSGMRLIGDVRCHHGSLRWHDYYSEGDTVAEAALAPPKCVRKKRPWPGDEHPIENKPSNPHGGYWDNDEEFLLPVVNTLIAAAAREPDPPRPDEKDERKDQPEKDPQPDRDVRIGMFSFTSRILFGAMVSTILASGLFGGGRMDNIGAWLASAVSQVPGNELVTVPIGLLHELSTRGELEWSRGVGTFVVTALLLLAAAYALIRILPPKLAWGTTRRQTMSRWPIVLTDLLVGVLPLLLVWIWLLRWWLGYGGGYAPASAVISAGALLIGLVVAGLVIFNLQDDNNPRVTDFKLNATASGILAAVSLIAVGVGTFSAVMAVVANEPFGEVPLAGAPRLGMLVLGAALVWLLFKLLGGVANWRWDAWDGREREAFRKRRGVSGAWPLLRFEQGGRVFDLIVIALVTVAATAIGLAVGLPLFADATIEPAFIWAGVASVVIIFLIGVAQDAYNSRADRAPLEVTPLPSSAS